jgi:hypothetical protein
MLPALLLLTSTFAVESSASLGKRFVAQRRETVYDLSFLGIFWGFIFLLSTLAFGAHWHLSLASAPIIVLRLVLETALARTISEASIRADRTTMAFLRLLTIPFLLVVDISLGYHFTNLQIAGVVLMFTALVLAFRHNPSSRKGAWLAVLSALLSVGTITLYKFDITHYNSVVAEQTIVLGGMLIYFYFAANLHRRSPLRLLLKPTTGTQALANGAAIALESYALSMAPASIIMTLKRSFALVWAIVFGGAFFHEHSLGRKISSGALLAISILLIASPQLLHL